MWSRFSRSTHISWMPNWWGPRLLTFCKVLSVNRNIHSAWKHLLAFSADPFIFCFFKKMMNVCGRGTLGSGNFWVVDMDGVLSCWGLALT